MRAIPWHVAFRTDVRAALTVAGVAMGVAFSIIGLAVPTALDGFAIAASDAFTESTLIVHREDGAPFDPTGIGRGDWSGVLVVEAVAADGRSLTLFARTDAPPIPPGFALGDGAPEEAVSLEITAPSQATLQYKIAPFVSGYPRMWLELEYATLAAVAGVPTGYVTTVLIDGAPPGTANALRAEGHAVSETPGVTSFFRESAREIARDMLVVVIFSIVLVALFVYESVRAEVEERRFEISVWRGVGFRRGDVARIFVARATVLSATGALLGAAVSVGLLTAAERVTGAGVFSAGVAWPLVGMLIALFALAGAVAGLFPAVAAARAPPTARRGRSRPRSIVVPLATLMTLVTLNIMFYSGIAAAPSSFFSESLVLGPSDGSLPGQGVVPSTLIGPLAQLPGVDGVSPEIYVTLSIGGRSAMVRGIDTQNSSDRDRPELLEGVVPALPHEALAGEGFAKLHDIEIGQRMILPAAFTRYGVPVTIVGVARFEGPMDDELLVSLDRARALTGLSTAEVHAVRLHTEEPDNVTAVIQSTLPHFTYSDVRISARTVTSGEEITAELNVTNWGRIGGTRRVEVRENGAVVGSVAVNLGPRETRSVTVPFRLLEPGQSEVSINPTFDVNVSEAPLVLTTTPKVLHAGQPYQVKVHDRAGAAQEGITVEVDGTAAGLTDASGTLELVAPDDASLTLTARRDGAFAGLHIAAIAERGFEGVARPRIIEAHMVDAYAEAGRPLRAVLTVRNVGGEPGYVDIVAAVNGTTIATARQYVDAGIDARMEILLPPLPAGLHEVELRPEGSPGTPLRVEVFEGDPRVEVVLRSYRALLETPPSGLEFGKDGAQDYIAKLTGNVQVATLFVSLTSFAMALLGISAVIRRYVSEREPDLAVMKALGARDRYVLDAAARGAVRFAAISTFIGVPIAFGMGLLIGTTGEVRAFGHAVRPTLEWNMAVLVVLVSPLLTGLVATAAAYAALRNPPDELLRARHGRIRERGPPALVDIIEGAPP